MYGWKICGWEQGKRTERDEYVEEKALKKSKINKHYSKKAMQKEFIRTGESIVKYLQSGR
jgi:hypothetical protein